MDEGKFTRCLSQSWVFKVPHTHIHTHYSTYSRQIECNLWAMIATWIKLERVQHGKIVIFNQFGAIRTQIQTNHANNREWMSTGVRNWRHCDSAVKNTCRTNGTRKKTKIKATERDMRLLIDTFGYVQACIDWTMSQIGVLCRPGCCCCHRCCCCRRTTCLHCHSFNREYWWASEQASWMNHSLEVN